MDPGALLAWLGKEALGPLLLEEAFGRAKRGDWESRLAKDVAHHASFRISRRRLKKWLRRSDVGNALVGGTPEAFVRLSSSVPADLGGAGHADELVELLVGQFLASLSPAMATAVDHYRVSSQLDEIKSTLQALNLIPSVPTYSLPPNAAELQPEAMKESPLLTSRLLNSAFNELQSPDRAIQELVTSPPIWLEEASAFVWLLLASLAEGFECRSEASLAYEKAAELGAPNRVRWYVLAATNVSDSDSVRAGRLMDRAKALNPRHPLVLVVDAILRQDLAAAAEPPDGLEALALPDRALVLAIQVQALIHQSRFDEAIALAETAMEMAPSRSGMLIIAAQAHLRRAQLGGGPSREGDLVKARQLALRARDLRRAWAGPSGNAVAIAARAAVMSGDWMGAVRICLPPPEGVATPGEANDGEVVELALNASLVLKRTDVVRRLAGSSASEAERLLAEAASLEQEAGCSDQVRDLYVAALAAAEDPDRRFAALYGLADCGVWPIAGLEEFMKEFPEQGGIILALSEMKRDDYEGAKERLRPLAKTSRPAAVTLARAYEESGEGDASAELWLDVHERFKDESALLEAAKVHFRAGRLEAAADLIERALALLPEGSPSRTTGRRMLIELSAAKGVWSDVEKLASALLADDDKDPQTRWALVLALNNLGRLSEAWNALNHPTPLDPRSAIEATMWMMLKARFGVGEPTVVDILRIASQFTDDEQVLASAIMAITQVGREADLSPSTVARSQALTSSFIERFPDSKILWSISAEPEVVFEELRTQLEPAHEQIGQLRDAVAAGNSPLGMMATVRGRSYAEAVASRAAGFIVLGSVDLAVNEQEKTAARASLGTRIITEASAVHTLILVSDVQSRLIGAFTELEIPSISLLDLHAASNSLSMRATGAFVWDPQTRHVRMQEISAEEANRLAETAEQMVLLAESFRTIDWPRFHIPDLAELDFNRFGSWLAPLDAAKAQSRILFSDDVALRALARSLEVPAFGTLALVEVLRGLNRLSETEVQGARLTLRRNWGVDLPIQRDEMLEVARREGFSAGAAGAPLLRRAFWQDLASATPVFRELLREVSAHRPSEISAWVAQATVGFVGAGFQSPNEAAVSLAAVTAMIVEFDAELFASAVAGMSRGFVHLGLADPLEDICRRVSKILLSNLGPEDGARQFLGLVGSLPDEQRHVALRVLFEGESR